MANPRETKKASANAFPRSSPDRSCTPPSSKTKQRRTRRNPSVSSPPLVVTTPSTANLSSPEDSWSTSSGEKEDNIIRHHHHGGRRTLFPTVVPPKLRSRKVLHEIYSWAADDTKVGSNHHQQQHQEEYCYSSDDDRHRLSAAQQHQQQLLLLQASATQDSYSDHSSNRSQRRRSNKYKRKQPPGRTKWMAFLLCCIGLSSVSMVMVTNHKIMPKMEHHDHAVAVLFHQDKQRPATSATTTTTTTTKGRINLHGLAHMIQQHDEKTGGNKKKVSHPKTVLPSQKEQRVHRPQEHTEKHNHRHHKKDPIESTRPHARPQTDPFDGGLERIAMPEGKLVKRSLLEPTVDHNLYRTDASSDHRRVVSISPELHHPAQHRSVPLYAADFTDNTQYYSMLDSNDEKVASTMELRKPLVQGECVPMQEWQTTFHPVCNGMHELDMAAMGDSRTEDDFKLFGMKGFWRNAWRLDSIGGHASLDERDKVVLKTLRINHRFEDSYYENNRIDAVVLERLTASPHVINVFGFCGHSVLTEFADGKRLGELADKKKKEPRARLSIARDIANGLADVHGIDGDGNATFVHFDINPANVVSIGGTLKLNDFNIGVLRRWNTTSNSACGIPAQYPNPQWRSPEEARGEQDLTEKIDVFSLGHILFRLICSHEPWHKLEPGGMPSKEELNEKVKQGILPTIPRKVMESKDPEVVAIRDAMLRCYTYDPVERPSAREIASSLQKALDKMERKQSALRGE